MLISPHDKDKAGFKVLSASFSAKLSTIAGIEECCHELESILAECRRRTSEDSSEALFASEVLHDLKKCNLLWLKKRFELIGDVPSPIELKQLILELALDEPR